MFINHFVASSLLIVALAPALSAQGIQFFEGSWADAKAKAAKENKHIFVDAYATWCGPCKMLAKDVFPQAEVGTFFNEKFVNVKIDVEKGEGVQFAADYSVTAMPTLFYFAPNGELVHKTLGGSQADDLLANAAKALDPNAQLYSNVARFRKGEKGQEFLTKLILSLNEVGDAQTANEVFKALWSPLNLEQRSNPDVFDLAYLVRDSYSSEVFNYIVANRKAFDANNPAGYVDIYIEGIIENSVHLIAENPNTDPAKDFKPFNVSVKKHLPKRAKYYQAKLDYLYHFGKDAKSKDALKYQKTYLDKHSDDAMELNEMAWNIVGTGETPDEFKKALVWIDRSIKISRNPFSLDTKAWILHKLNRNAEAKTLANEAIQSGKEFEVDMSATQELLDLINAAAPK